MTRRPPTTETRIDLRTILSVGVLALLVLVYVRARWRVWALAL